MLIVDEVDLIHKMLFMQLNSAVVKEFSSSVLVVNFKIRRIPIFL
jgi:hypothetical protein